METGKILYVELTPEEQLLYDQVNRAPLEKSKFREPYRGDQAFTLLKMLLARKAIPELRIRYFTDPSFNIGTKKSRKQIFEVNGTKGDEIFKHPHFLPFLIYFISGPNLPKEIIDNFNKLVAAEPYISGSDLQAIQQFVRNATRQHDLIPREACEEFYKLALECGLGVDHSRFVRETVRSMKIPR